MKVEEKDINKFILIGDRLLIKPTTPSNKTKSGLYLPPGVQEREKIASGYVVKVGPGFPIPLVNEPDEPWKDARDQVKYVPIQPQAGDLALYIQKTGWEIEFNGEKYVIVNNSAVLMVIRDEELFD